jgi:hypothetical protein
MKHARRVEHTRNNTRTAVRTHTCTHNAATFWNVRKALVRAGSLTDCVLIPPDAEAIDKIELSAGFNFYFDFLFLIIPSFFSGGVSSRCVSRLRTNTIKATKHGSVGKDEP